jgi:hypothetical protein
MMKMHQPKTHLALFYKPINLWLVFYTTAHPPYTARDVCIEDLHIVYLCNTVGTETEEDDEDDDDEPDDGQVEDYMKAEQAKLEEEKKALMENHSMVAGVSDASLHELEVI